jgi:two-component system CheB/CheR fusion protein
MNVEATEPTGIAAIGASAGGLQAYTEFLEALPATTNMAFVIVQHLAAGHESFLTTLLGRITSMPVLEVDDGKRIEANTIYVIPPNRTMIIDDGHFRLREREPGLHLSVDIFLKALALSHGPRAIGVILSGTGSDGMKGVEAIKTSGGTTFAQDQSAQHSGMPTSAISTGCIDFVMSPRNIAYEISKLASVPELAFSDDPVEPAENLDSIVALLRQRGGIDFSQYKENTLRRRIRRRMALSQSENLADYLALLREKPGEIETLAQDILINVTGFFRDPKSFEALKTIVFPQLLARQSEAVPIRVWVVGCSTGEEAYSLAIALIEAMDEVHSKCTLSVFGTDVNVMAVERARRGWYPRSIEEDVSQQRLKRFFTEADEGYVISKSLRERCVFAPHNAITDPPFSRMDIVSCRNLLIYFQGGPQRKLLPLLHYALKPGGTLFLGASESINNYRDLFDQQDVRHKIYVRRAVPSRPNETSPVVSSGLPLVSRAMREIIRPSRDRYNDRYRVAEILALKHFAPAGVVVDTKGEILQFRGDTSPYLTQSDGRASLNLLKIAREGLFVAIRAGLQHASKESSTLRTEGVVVKNDTGLLAVTVTVIPIVYPSQEDRCCWIFFEPKPPLSIQQADDSLLKSGAAVNADSAHQISVLSDELIATRDHLRVTILEQESVNEDLQAANEEVQSANEELQSTNEELETSKEELQSSNEELSTVNDELRLRNEELDRANNDLLNLFSSVQMAVVMVWPDLRIRRFTPPAEKVFNIRPADVGRSITDLNHNINLADLPTLLKQAIEQGREVERDVQSIDGHWYLLRLRPYRTHQGAVDGAIVLLVDIDTLAHTQDSLRKRVAELAAVDRHRNEFLAVLAHELRNPLAPLRNAVQILNRAPADQSMTAKVRDLIDRQVQHMSRLVSDLLDAARSQNGQIKLQKAPLDLRSSIEHVVDLMRPQFEAKQQVLTMRLPEAAVWVNGDAARLEQAITNLLSNANKFTQEHGEAEIELSTVAEAGTGHAAVRVTDNGDGVEAEVAPRLFELFVQADRSLAHSQGGLGIGLSLVRTIVELHGGRVFVRSEGSGRGSTFEMQIPLSRAPATATAPQLPVIAETSTRPPHRLLIVEDNKDVRDSTCELLAIEGFEVGSASTGTEALEMVSEFSPTAILMDVGLPDLSGYDVARRLRRMPQFASTLLIAITGYDTPDAHSLSDAAGFDHHICKPVNLVELQQLLR